MTGKTISIIGVIAIIAGFALTSSFKKIGKIHLDAVAPVLLIVGVIVLLYGATKLRDENKNPA